MQNAVGFSYQPILVPGADLTQTIGISNTQVVVGYYQVPITFEYVGYISNGRSLTMLRHPGSIATFCFGVNSSNKVVGQYIESTTSTFRGFVWQNGVFTDLLPIGAGGASTESAGFAINDLGDIAGYFVDALGTHGFIHKNSTYTVLDVAGLINTYAAGINNLDVVTVQASDANGHVNSFVYQNGTFTLFNVPGALNSYIHAINDAGAIVYTYQNTDGGAIFGKAYARKKFYDVTYPGSANTYADGINNLNVVSGSTSFPDGSNSGFVATPTR